MQKVWIMPKGYLIQKMKNNRLFICLLPFLACGTPKTNPNERLPFFGEPSLVQFVENGVRRVDTIYPILPGFEMLNQKRDTIRETDVMGKIHIVDFFFTTCPTICPIMSSQLSRVHEYFRNDSQLVILSYSIDPRFDTPEVLQAYATKMDATLPGWHFLSGSLESVYDLADAHGAFARPEKTAPGGFEHSAAIILVDGERRVRGVYNGVDAKEVDKLIADIVRLKND
jgi:protein SCO1/2